MRTAALSMEKRGDHTEYDALVNAAPAGVLLMDERGSIVKASREAAASLGFSTLELERKGLRDCLPLGVARGRLAHLLEVVASGEPVAFSDEWSGRFFDNVIVPLPSGNGRGPLFALFSTDVTRRRHSRKLLEDLNRCLLQLGPDPRANIRMLVENGREMLDGASMKYKRTREGELPLCSFAEDLDQATLTFLHRRPCDIEDSCSGCLMLERKAPILCDEPGRDEPGCADSWFSASEAGYIMAYPVMIASGPVGCLAVAGRDTDPLPEDAREMMGVLAHSIGVEEQRLDHEREVRDFIAVASHELRHPITIIKGYTGTLESYGERLDDAMRSEMLHDIDRGADRLTRLVSELLDTSKISRDGLTLNLKEAGIPALVSRAVDLAAQKMPERSVEIRLSEDLGVQRVDAVLLVKAVYQLLENAINFSEEDTVVEVEAFRGREAVHIRVLDRGIGIPEEHSKSIFERFFRVSPILHHSVPGIGLGLYIARSIVEEHGGVIAYVPRDGGGSIFEITIPDH